MTETPSQLLRRGLAELGLALGDDQAQMLMAYLSELLAWNERFNLTAITDEREAVTKHLLDSLSLLGAIDVPPGCTLVDIGAGAGFPGIPLKIARPDLALTLVESQQKKAGFLRHVVEMLGLESARVAAERAEDFGRRPENRENFCLAVARAVAEIAVLAEYALPLLKVGGRFVCYKARGARDEAKNAERAIHLLGGRIEEIANVVVPFLHAERYLVSIVKVAPSPAAYPRKAGTPSKKPLV